MASRVIRSMFKRKILFISPVPSHPQTAGNRTRVGALLSALRSLGHEVHFLHVGQEPGDIAAMQAAWGKNFSSVKYHAPIIPLIRRIRRKLLGVLSEDAKYVLDIDAWYDEDLDSRLSSLHREHMFDVVIVSYVFFSRALEVFDDQVLKIIDTHDAFANRHRQYLARGETPAWFTTSEKGEAKAFGRADLVFAIQEKERVAFTKLTRTKVVSLGHITPIDPLDRSLAEPNRILFVASDNNINVNGIRFFIDQVLPRVQQEIPSVELALAGSICRAIEDLPAIRKLGRVDDLRATYASAELVVNPVLFNTGVSIKNLEALGFGKALLTATVGTEGIESGLGTAYLVADSAPDFAARTIELLTDAALNASLAAGALRYITQSNQLISKVLQSAISMQAS
jgi:polysaccharide biosynthesis protein PslH